jgi:DNA adenine methylase
MRQLRLLADDEEIVGPLFKWAGGKRWISPVIGPHIRQYLNQGRGRYIEPFLGGAALAFWLGSPGMLLADIEAPLIEAYVAVRDECNTVECELSRLILSGTDAETYARVRGVVPAEPSARAARLMYLNRLCFNGLYRTNRRGLFNVPYGRYDRPLFPSSSHLRAVSGLLSTAAIRAQDFEATISEARAGDVIFADPPYHSTGAGFVSYHQKPFGEAEQVRLAAALRAASERGVTVVSTNADTDLIRTLYEWAPMVPTGERRAINSSKTGRGRVQCLLIGLPIQLLGGLIPRK